MEKQAYEVVKGTTINDSAAYAERERLLLASNYAAEERNLFAQNTSAIINAQADSDAEEDLLSAVSRSDPNLAQAYRNVAKGKREYYLAVLIASVSQDDFFKYLENFTDTEIQELTVVARVQNKDTQRLSNLLLVPMIRQRDKRMQEADKRHREEEALDEARYQQERGPRRQTRDDELASRLEVKKRALDKARAEQELEERPQRHLNVDQTSRQKAEKERLAEAALEERRERARDRQRAIDSGELPNVEQRRALYARRADGVATNLKREPRKPKDYSEDDDS